MCWGSNVTGQLGDGTTTNRWLPVNVTGLQSGVSAIGAGTGHTCALTTWVVNTGGGVKCWGDNTLGEVGDGTTVNRTTPVDVLGLTSGVIAISVGGQHTCALTSGGGVKCWGFAYGVTPVDVIGATSGIIAISAGAYHTCALTSVGGVKCWDYNNHGQLGDGTTTDRARPVDVIGLTSGTLAISAGGALTCALTANSGVKCWGYNLLGQLGDGTTTNRAAPVDVIGLTGGVSAISAGDLFTCVLTSAGGVKCWGENQYGQLGMGTFGEAHAAPVDVSGLTSRVSAISAGLGFACALTAAGEVKCWGNNNVGQLGDGTKFNRWQPVDVMNLGIGVRAISAGGNHACALTAGGGVKCWGLNNYGNLGDGTTTARTTPVDVIGLASGVSAISAGDSFTCVLTSVGGVECWGWNKYGQLGNSTNTDSARPINVSGLTGGVIAISAGANHTCALTSTGKVKCWGWNKYSQLGDGTTTNRTTPVDVFE